MWGVGGELVQDCMQMHGGIGVICEHDLHLFMRRLVVSRSVDGSAAVHRQRLAALAIAQEVA